MKQRTHFTRILSKAQVKACQQMLEECSGRLHPIDWNATMFQIKAPDGDEVFAGLKHPSGKYICRLHREVFEERTA